MSQHYTYIYLSPEGVPYYVGKGINGRFFEDHGRIPVPPKERIQRFDHETKEAAYAHERELVAKYGRMDLGTGSLMNMNDGGGGQINPAAHVRKAMRANGRKAVKSGQLAKGCSFGGKATGKTLGKRNVESGQLASIRSSGGQKSVETGHLERIRAGSNHIRWHVKRGIPNPECSFCQVKEAK